MIGSLHVNCRVVGGGIMGTGICTVLWNLGDTVATVLYPHFLGVEIAEGVGAVGRVVPPAPQSISLPLPTSIS